MVPMSRHLLSAALVAVALTTQGCDIFGGKKPTGFSVVSCETAVKDKLLTMQSEAEEALAQACAKGTAKAQAAGLPADDVQRIENKCTSTGLQTISDEKQTSQTDLYNSCITAVEQELGKAGDKVLDLSKTAKTAASDFMAKHSQSFSDIQEKLKATVTEQAVSFKDKLANSLAAFLDAAQSAASNATQTAKEAIDKAKEATDQAKEAALGKAVKATDQAKEAVDKAVKAGAKEAQDAVNAAVGKSIDNAFKKAETVVAIFKDKNAIQAQKLFSDNSVKLSSSEGYGFSAVGFVGLGGVSLAVFAAIVSRHWRSNRNLSLSGDESEEALLE